jgi:hypothetical protein
VTPLDSETMVAALGLDRILAGTPSLTQEAREASITFPKRARALLLKALSSKEPDADEAEEPDFDYTTVSDLLRDVGEEQNQALFDALPDDIQDAVLAAATTAIEYLQNTQPRRITKTTARLEVSPPEPYELDRFVRAWRVAVDPLSAVKAMTVGALDMVMVGALAAAYPAIYELLAGEGGLLDDAIATMKARRGEKWDVTDDQDRQIKILLQEDPIDLDLANDFADLAPPQQAPPMKKSSGQIKPQDELLPSQKSPA